MNIDIKSNHFIFTMSYIILICVNEKISTLLIFKLICINEFFYTFNIKRCE